MVYSAAQVLCLQLIFCLDVLSNIESGALKSPTFTVLLLISPLNSVNVRFIYLDALRLGAYISQWLILCVTCSNLLSPLRESLLCCTGLCLLYHRSSGGAAQCQLFLVFSGPQAFQYARSCQCSKTSETEASPSGRHPKKPEHWIYGQPCLSLTRRSRELGVSSQSCGTVLRRGTMVKGRYKFSYEFQCSRFHANLGAGGS